MLQPETTANTTTTTTTATTTDPVELSSGITEPSTTITEPSTTITEPSTTITTTDPIESTAEHEESSPGRDEPVKPLTTQLDQIQDSSLPPLPPRTTSSQPFFQVDRPQQEESIYHLKWFEWKGIQTPIVTQNENGPCPLLAIANVLILARKIDLPPMQQIISGKQLMEYIGKID